MLRWALAFFVIAIIAAVFGFTGVAAAAAGIAVAEPGRELRGETAPDADRHTLLQTNGL